MASDIGKTIAMISTDKYEVNLRNLVNPIFVVLRIFKYLDDWIIQAQKVKATVEYTVVLSILKNITLTKLRNFKPFAEKVYISFGLISILFHYSILIDFYGFIKT